MPDNGQRYTSTAWRALARYVRERDGHLCQIRDKGCTHVATTVDHIEPLMDGGAMWDERNLRAACKTCNSRRGALDQARRSARYRRAVATYESRM